MSSSKTNVMTGVKFLSGGSPGVTMLPKWSPGCLCRTRGHTLTTGTSSSRLLR
ncbi:hypothetical protein DPMN_139189 [Dreissena polymorpha]|uniref:Uncharacterized protein n=1 Tax=Dreissena polymorpha TaxID=45954 RepID=A0A9D4G8K8_DREPO|nr:hypothetical protein DPMN_139189 [Dreissena polymorpha]